jgi:rsbT co-antagonist protein RsbR
MVDDVRERLARAVTVFQAVLDALPYVMFWKDTRSVFYGCNRACADAGGLERVEDIVGLTDLDMPWRELAEGYVADDKAVLASGSAKLGILEQIRKSDGTVQWVETHKAPLRDEKGEVIGLVGWFHDVTDRKLAEEAAERAQQRALQELATPLLPVADGVLVMPLIGKIDRARADQVMETLLGGVSRHRAHSAILDITGVRTVDAEVSQALARAARGIRLLGAEAVVTGVRPEVAQAMLTAGAELGDVVVLGDLKAGVAHALRRR